MEAGSYAERLAAVGVAGIALMALLGVLQALDVAPAAFDLDEEYTVPAFFSGLLLVAGAVGLYRLARTGRGGERTIMLLASAFLVFLALDEVFSFHERIDSRTDVDWQVLYLLPALAFVWVLWRIRAELGAAGAGRMIVWGVAAWVTAQLLEAVAWSEVIPSLIDDETMTRQEVRDIEHSVAYHAISIPEEVLEMTGSLLFAVAFALCLALRTARRH